MSEPKTWAELRAVVLYRDGYRCQICGVAEATDADHIWPRSAGGPDGLENLQAACKSCNSSKGAGYNIADATIQQLMWLQNHTNARLEEAEEAAEESRRWLRTFGAALSTSSRLRVAEVSEQRTETGSLLAETFDLLSRTRWSGSSLGWVTAEQIRKVAAETREAAEARHAILIAECEAGERIADEMDNADAPSIGEFIQPRSDVARMPAAAVTALWNALLPDEDES